MNYTVVQKKHFLTGKRLGFGLFFLFSLIFLLAGSLPTLFNLPGLRARFTGVQTTALATAYESCGDDEGGGGDYYQFTFTDSHEKVQRVTDTTCTSGIVSDGEHVTIWYQPNDPSQFITANDLTFDTIFLAGFSIPMLIYIVLSFIALFRFLSRSTPPLGLR